MSTAREVIDSNARYEIARNLLQKFGNLGSMEKATKIMNVVLNDAIPIILRALEPLPPTQAEEWKHCEACRDPASCHMLGKRCEPITAIPSPNTQTPPTQAMRADKDRDRAADSVAPPVVGGSGWFAARCKDCGFEYREHLGHIIACPVCSIVQLDREIEAAALRIRELDAKLLEYQLGNKP